jgi:hypothetical protein
VRLEVAYEDASRQVFLATRDVSATGLYLHAEDPPEPGVEARVVLEIPGHAAILRLPGLVVRREPGLGFAMQLDEEKLPDDWAGALRVLARG